jgi:hypothetical protein
MNDFKDFEIHYRFRGEPRCFCHQAPYLCESDALHFATLHACVGTLDSKVAAEPFRIAVLSAEGLGVTQVHWNLT